MIRVVRTGGLVFTTYLDVFATSVVHRMWKKAVKDAKAASTTMIDEIAEDAVHDAGGNLYYGFIIQAAVGLYRRARVQRFYPAFVARFHGLSKIGTDLLSSWGFTMPSTSYDRALKGVLERSVEELKYVSKY